MSLLQRGYVHQAGRCSHDAQPHFARAWGRHLTVGRGGVTGGRLQGFATERRWVQRDLGEGSGHPVLYSHWISQMMSHNTSAATLTANAFHTWIFTSFREGSSKQTAARHSWVSKSK